MLAAPLSMAIPSPSKPPPEEYAESGRALAILKAQLEATRLYNAEYDKLLRMRPGPPARVESPMGVTFIGSYYSMDDPSPPPPRPAPAPLQLGGRRAYGD